MSTHVSHAEQGASGREQSRLSLDKRFAALFWPLMFILAGVIWLFPEQRVPDGTWLIGIGVILLSLNTLRVLNGIPIRVLSSILGALALAGGLAEYGGARLPLISLTLIALGTSVILELWANRHGAS